MVALVIISKQIIVIFYFCLVLFGWTILVFCDLQLQVLDFGL